MKPQTVETNITWDSSGNPTVIEEVHQTYPQKLVTTFIEWDGSGNPDRIVEHTYINPFESELKEAFSLLPGIYR